MIERSKSFSKGGGIIERIMEIDKYKIDKEQLNRMLHSKHSKIAGTKHEPKEPIII